MNLSHQSKTLHLDISECENVFNDHFLMMMSNHTRGRFEGNLILIIFQHYYSLDVIHSYVIQYQRISQNTTEKFLKISMFVKSKIKLPK